MIRVVVGGTVRDKYVETSSEDPYLLGEKYEIDHALGEFYGGACANISATLSGLGARDTYVYTKLGDDAVGREALAYYEKMGINTSYIPTPSGESGESIILLSTTSKQRMIFVRRVALGADDIRPNLLEETGAQWVFMTSIGSAAQRMLDLVAEKPDVSVSVIFGHREIGMISAGSLQIPAALGDRPHAVLVLNLGEWNDLSAFHARLSAAFTEIVVTDGANGMRLDCDVTGARVAGGVDEWLHVAACVPSGSIQDTSGAGDLSTAAYSYARSLGADRLTSARFAAVVAAMGICRIGAHTGAADAGVVPTLEALVKFVNEKY